MEKLKKIEITVENEKPEKEKSMKSKAEKKNPKDKRKKCKYCRCVKTLDEERYFEEPEREVKRVQNDVQVKNIFATAHSSF